MQISNEVLASRVKELAAMDLATLAGLGVLGAIAYLIFGQSANNAPDVASSVPDATGTSLQAGGDVAGTPAPPPDLASSTPAPAPPSASSGPLATVQQWANAIFGVEGTAPTDRSVRNNNPGNLRVTDYTGQIGTDTQGFAIFDSLAAGMKALVADLKGLISKHPDFTLLQAQTHYLGGDPNNPAVTDQGNPFAYANTVAGALGVNTSDTLAQVFGVQ